MWFSSALVRKTSTALNSPVSAAIRPQRLIAYVLGFLKFLKRQRSNAPFFNFEKRYKFKNKSVSNLRRSCLHCMPFKGITVQIDLMGKSHDLDNFGTRGNRIYCSDFVRFVFVNEHRVADR